MSTTLHMYEGAQGFYKDSSGNSQASASNPLVVSSGNVIDFSRLANGNHARTSWANFTVTPAGNNQGNLFTTAQPTGGYGSGNHTVSAGASGVYTLSAPGGTVPGQQGSDTMTGTIRVGSGPGGSDD